MMKTVSILADHVLLRITNQQGNSTLDASIVRGRECTPALCFQCLSKLAPFTVLPVDQESGSSFASRMVHDRHMPSDLHQEQTDD